MALLLVPFALSALLPQGYMPTVQAEGGFTVTLCTTDGLRTVTLDANGVEIPPGSEEDPDTGAMEHCVFAGVGSYLDSDRALDLKAPFTTTHLVQPLHPVVWSLSDVSGQNGARAPPHGARSSLFHFEPELKPEFDPPC
ncbi:MAG: hypothetical protein K5905_10255 [Roseibium sp.]|uniref:DUF2946 family protein n=1 Tax=Roseibium sp. TaxID=1936156 RepID=UPI0026260FA5|nr:DUF2946 family protein [Roseibium sp.]MCV0425846.1 hypothetical protein [Roseibium sp.]